MLSVCRKFEFCYGHHLPNHEGKCFNQHGHNSILEIEISGPVQISGPETGMIIDFKVLDFIVKELIVNRLDHQYLNEIGFENPTAENIVCWIKKELIEKLKERPQIMLVRVRVYETSNSYAEWKIDKY